jgi:hypothetical protein
VLFKAGFSYWILDLWSVLLQEPLIAIGTAKLLHLATICDPEKAVVVSGSLIGASSTLWSWLISKNLRFSREIEKIQRVYPKERYFQTPHVVLSYFLRL